jgi:nucleoside 2-deoxyribosyltransferase
MEGTEKNCPICGGPIEKSPAERGYFVECPKCGDFTTHRDIFSVLPHDKVFPKVKHLVSGYYRYCKEYLIEPVAFHWPTNKDKILQQSIVPDDKDINRKLDFILKYVDAKCESIGQNVIMRPSFDFPIGFCHNDEEFFLLTDHLRDAQLINFQINVMRNAMSQVLVPSSYPVNITVLGKSRFAESGHSSNQIFVAMEFSPEMLEIFSSIRHDVEQATRYKLALVNDFKHNATIDNKIIAEINRSAALIADFSSNNRGAYYEAGYAHGQGKEVIFICKDAPDPNSKDQKRLIDGVHFDTRQRNHILWRDAEHLKTELTDWILATLPRK